MEPVYEFQSVVYNTPEKSGNGGPVCILSHAEFSIEPGKLTVISGPSGAGKSTLLRLFNRLADPTSGSINFHSSDIKSYPVTDLRRRIGWVPQVPVRFNGTVDENLRLPFTLRSTEKTSASDIDKAIDSVKKYGLLKEELYQRDASDLSVGEAQRLNVLRALVLKPEVLLLDEPTSALDGDSAAVLLGQIEEIFNSRTLTAIMVTHRPEEVERMGDRVLFVRNGVIKSGWSGGGEI